MLRKAKLQGANLSNKWAFFFNPYKEEALEYAKDLEIVLAERGIEVQKFYGEEPFPERKGIKHVGNDYDVVLVFGGDGTFYRAAKFFIGLPIVAVNFGAKGFLCTFNPWAPVRLYRRIISALNRGSFVEFEPLKLSYKNREYLIIGDVVVIHEDFGKSVTLNIKIDDTELLVTGDGLIVATSAGSTGYALSTGGPLVDITLGSITVTFIASQNPFSRPLILTLDRNIRIVNRSHIQKAKVIVDGEELGLLRRGERISVARSGLKVKLLVPPEFDMITKWKSVFMLGKT